MLGAGAAAFVVNTRAQADVSRLAGEARSRELLRFHVWGGAGGFATPLLVAGALALGLSWRAGYWMLAALFLAYAAVAVPALEATAASDVAGRRRRLTASAWLAVASAAGGIAIQVTVPLFLASLLVGAYGAGDAAGTTAVGCFALAVLAGRALAVALLPRLGPDRLLRALTLVALAAYAPLALADSAVAVAAATTLLGAGIGPVMPLAVARAAQVIRDDRSASSLAFTLSGVAQMALPAAVAASTPALGLQGALAGTAVVAAFLVLAVARSQA